MYVTREFVYIQTWPTFVDSLGWRHQFCKLFGHCPMLRKASWARSYALMALYCAIEESLWPAWKAGIYDFINNSLLAELIEYLSHRWKTQGKKVCRGAQSLATSTRAHHRVDLLLFFGKYDLSSCVTAETTGSEMRKRWILFIRYERRWESKGYSLGDEANAMR